jgi:hypothetical protein
MPTPHEVYDLKHNGKIRVFPVTKDTREINVEIIFTVLKSREKEIVKEIQMLVERSKLL